MTYVRAASDEKARVLAVARRSAMVAEQVARGREAVAALAERLSAEECGEVLARLEAGPNKVFAVKFARETLQCGLREAIRIVEYLDDQRKEVA